MPLLHWVTKEQQRAPPPRAAKHGGGEPSGENHTVREWGTPRVIWDRGRGRIRVISAVENSRAAVVPQFHRAKACRIEIPPIRLKERIEPSGTGTGMLQDGKEDGSASGWTSGRTRLSRLLPNLHEPGRLVNTSTPSSFLHPRN